MKKLNGILGSLMLLFLGACSKEISNNNNFTPYTDNPLNDTAWVKNITDKAAIYALTDSLFQRNVFTDSIDLTKDQSLEFGDSLEVEFKANSLNNGYGTALDGKAKVEIVRILTKGDFIEAYRPNSSFGYPLTTAGGFFVRITKNGSELALNQGSSIKIKYSDIEAPRNNMQVFYGKESFPFPTGTLDSAHTWIRDMDTSWIKTFTKTTSSGDKTGYELEAKKLRWISAHQYLDATLPKTNIYAILPPNFTNKNTVVFTVFAQSRTVLGMRGDLPSRSFVTGNIPLRTKIILVSLSKIGDDLYLGTKTVNDVGSIVNYSFSPEKKSLAQILEYLKSL